MLYTKQINEISYEDVLAFCGEGHSEGFILEYKRDFESLTNEKLAKTIAAFANTYGGILIIGINAPNGIPIAPIEGIVVDPSMKYEEKIESVILAHIKEPVFPEVRVCEPKDGKTFIVVRVAESHLTPHRVANNTKIYVRTGQSSTPNAEGTWDKIEWLASRRKKSEELRELILLEGELYFKDACNIRGINPEDKNHYFATLSIESIPLFPQEPLIKFRDLDEIVKNITVHDLHHGSFPHNLYETDAIQNGIRKLEIMTANEKEPAHGKGFIYTHLNTFGLYLYKRDIGEIDKPSSDSADGSEDKNRIKRTYFYRLLSVMHQFMASAILFYQEIGYWGSIHVKIELINALGVRLQHRLNNDVFFGFDTDLFVPSDHLIWEKTASCAILRERMRDFVVEMIDNMAWSLGIRYFTEERIRKYLEDNYGK